MKNLIFPYDDLTWMPEKHALQPLMLLCELTPLGVTILAGTSCLTDLLNRVPGLRECYGPMWIEMSNSPASWRWTP